MKKKVLSLLMVTAMVFSLAACSSSEGSSSSSEESSSSTESSSSEEASTDSGGSDYVELWYYWETVGHQEALNTVIEEFNDSQDKYTVEAKYVPFADFEKQVSIGAAADSLPDIVILDNPDHAAYASMGIFADLTDEFDLSTYYDGPVDSCTYDGKLYGVPFGSNDLLLYYNEDMLKEAGCEVPATWDELKEVAAACTKDNVSGFAHSGLQNDEGTFNFLLWQWSAGADTYDIDSEGGIKGLEFIQDMVDSGAMTKESINWTQGDVMNQFISGNLAMMINGTWQVPTMREEAPDLNWNVASIPVDEDRVTGLGGENYAVISGGNEDGAIEFIKYATDEEHCLYLMDKMGYISANSEYAVQQWTDDEVYQKFIEEMNYAKARGPLANWAEVSDAISLAYNEVITGGSTPEAAAEKAQGTIDSALGK